MKFTFILFSVVSIAVKAGNENYPIGARSSALSGASVAFSDLWSIHHNQAGLGFIRTMAAGTHYENRFLIKELSTKAAAFVLPVKGGTFGLYFTSFGYKLYSENKYCLSFGKSLGDKFSVGLAMDYLTTRIADGYGNKGIIAAELGFIARPLKDLSIGFHVFNPTRSKLVDYNDERLPTIIRLGGNYTFSDKVIVAIETQKSISQKAEFKAGIEYKAVKEFYLRAGISTNPTLSTFGMGLHLKNFKLDISGNYHQVLGLSSQISLSYTFKNINSK